MASLIGRDSNTIQKLMSNGSTSTIEKIAKELDVPVGYFFDEDYSITLNQRSKNGNNYSIHGNAAVVGGRGNSGCFYGNLTGNELAEKDEEIALLKDLLKEKEARLADKEKMIELLSSQIKP